MSALTFANLLHEIFDIDVPVGVIVSPATDLRALADYIEAAAAARRQAADRSPSVHGRDATEVRGRATSRWTSSSTRRRCTPPRRCRRRRRGAHGAVDRRDRIPGPLPGAGMARTAGLVGGQADLLGAGQRRCGGARTGWTTMFDSGDPELLAHYRELAADHLEVFAGDKGEPNLGLDQQTWQRLADTVDLIVDPAALVNHVLPYSQLFGPNVVGTAELIRLALTTKLKPYTYVSTFGVGDAGRAVGVHRGRRHPGDQPDPQGRRQLR